MLAKFLILFIALVALQAYAYEEILPTRTTDLADDLTKRADTECTRFRAEVQLGKRRIGYLSFGPRGADVSRDKRAGSQLHFDRNGKLRDGRNFVGAKSSRRGFSTLKLGNKKNAGNFDMDLMYDGSLCYSRSHNAIYSGNVPSSIKCNTITFKQSCITRPTQPNPSDTRTKRDLELDARSESPLEAAPLSTRDDRASAAWNAVRINAAL